MAPIRVTRLSVTPIKGLNLHHPSEIDLTRTGAVGDRRFFLVDDRGKPLSITRSGALTQFTAVFGAGDDRLRLRSADGQEWAATVRRGDWIASDFHGLRDVACQVVDGPWAAVLQEAVGRQVRLVWTPEDATAFDVNPVTLLGEGSVVELARRAGLDTIDSRRFRMLIEFDTAEPHVEDTWEGKRLDIGETRLIVGGAVPRCAAVTRHPEKGDRDLPLVKMIKSYRGLQEGPLGPGVHFGVYAQVDREGPIRVGDPVQVVG